MGGLEFDSCGWDERYKIISTARMIILLLPRPKKTLVLMIPFYGAFEEADSRGTMAAFYFVNPY